MNGSRKMCQVVEAITGWKLETIQEHMHLRVEKEPYMPLVIESWRQGGQVLVVIGHFGESNGDLMADPEMMFLCYEDEFFPLSWRNDWASLFRKVASVDGGGFEVSDAAGYADLLKFAEQWAENLVSQGFCRKKC